MSTKPCALRLQHLRWQSTIKLDCGGPVILQTKVHLLTCFNIWGIKTNLWKRFWAQCTQAFPQWGEKSVKITAKSGFYHCSWGEPVYCISYFVPVWFLSLFLREACLLYFVCYSCLVFITVSEGSLFTVFRIVFLSLVVFWILHSICRYMRKYKLLYIHVRYMRNRKC